MARSFVVADTHFSHKGVCEFLRDDGTKLRPWDNPEEMDEALIKNWNEVVKPKDRVNLAGDVAINRRGLKVLSRLNGRIRLIKGNHDIFKLSDYMPYCDDICAYHVHKVGEKKIIISHIPIHPDSLGRFGINIHGHLHDRSVPDPRYVCVSVEQTNWRPIPLEEAIDRAMM